MLGSVKTTVRSIGPDTGLGLVLGSVKTTVRSIWPDTGLGVSFRVCQCCRVYLFTDILTR